MRQKKSLHVDLYVSHELLHLSETFNHILLCSKIWKNKKQNNYVCEICYNIIL